MWHKLKDTKEKFQNFSISMITVNKERKISWQSDLKMYIFLYYKRKVLC